MSRVVGVGHLRSIQIIPPAPSYRGFKNKLTAMECAHLFKDGVCQNDNCGYVSFLASASAKEKAEREQVELLKQDEKELFDKENPDGDEGTRVP